MHVPREQQTRHGWEPKHLTTSFLHFWGLVSISFQYKYIGPPTRQGDVKQTVKLEVKLNQSSETWEGIEMFQILYMILALDEET